MKLTNRVLISSKTRRPTQFRANLTSPSATLVGSSGASNLLTPTHTPSGEYSLGKLSNVVANSRAQSQNDEPLEYRKRPPGNRRPADFPAAVECEDQASASRLATN